MAINYFKSDNVEVYPSAYRGTYKKDNELYTYNVESSIYTEVNHTLFSHINKDTYIITDPDKVSKNNPLEVLIHGYYFKILNPSELFDTTGKFNISYLGIRTKLVPIGTDQNSTILCAFTNDTNVDSTGTLDVANGDFVGLAYSKDVKPVEGQSSEYKYYFLDFTTNDKNELYGKIKNVDLEDDIITTEKIVDQSVTTDKLHDGDITTEKVKDEAITHEKIADNAIENNNIKNNTIENVKLLNKTIEGNKIKDSTIGTSHIIDKAVTSKKIAESNVLTEHIKDDNITFDKLGPGAIKYDPDKRIIADDAIRASNIAANSIIEEKIQNSAVTTKKVNDKAITTEKIADKAVTNDKIAQSAVKTDNLDSNAIIYGAKYIVNASGNGNRYTRSDKLLFIDNGEIKESNVNIGSVNNPVYLDNGIFKSVNRTGSYSKPIVGINDLNYAFVNDGIQFNSYAKIYLSGNKLYVNRSLDLSNNNIENIKKINVGELNANTFTAQTFKVSGSIICYGSPSIKLAGGQNIVFQDVPSEHTGTKLFIKTNNNGIKLSAEHYAYNPSSCSSTKDTENYLWLTKDYTQLNKKLCGTGSLILTNSSSESSRITLNSSDISIKTDTIVLNNDTKISNGRVRFIKTPYFNKGIYSDTFDLTYS